MFNMLSEHLFASQSLLKEWRGTPTSGGRLARSHWGEGFPCPRPLEWGRTQPLKPLLFDLPVPEENDWLPLGRSCPHRGISCRTLFSYCGGDHKRAYFDRVQNPVNLF